MALGDGRTELKEASRKTLIELVEGYLADDSHQSGDALAGSPWSFESGLELDTILPTTRN